MYVFDPKAEPRLREEVGLTCADLLKYIAQLPLKTNPPHSIEVREVLAPDDLDDLTNMSRWTVVSWCDHCQASGRFPLSELSGKYGRDLRKIILDDHFDLVSPVIATDAYVIGEEAGAHPPIRNTAHVKRLGLKACAIMDTVEEGFKEPSAYKMCKGGGDNRLVFRARVLHARATRIKNSLLQAPYPGTIDPDGTLAMSYEINGYRLGSRGAELICVPENRKGKRFPNVAELVELSSRLVLDCNHLARGENELRPRGAIPFTWAIYTVGFSLHALGRAVSHITSDQLSMRGNRELAERWQQLTSARLPKEGLAGFHPALGSLQEHLDRLLERQRLEAQRGASLLVLAGEAVAQARKAIKPMSAHGFQSRVFEGG